MWKKWFWATAALGVELYALHDCGLGCLVAHPLTTVKEREGGHHPTWQQLLVSQADCFGGEDYQSL